MNINGHNYEEYFLRYVDDELIDAERNAVEDFVRQNPRYKASFELLQQTKLSIDEKFEFTGKNSLYKQEENDIGVDNYETYFLLYTDNELSEADKAATERFVLQHPHLQRNFTLLQQTRLPLENFEYKDKKKLFKNETKRRSIPLYLGRWAVAASVAALLALTWQFLSHDSETTGTTAINTGLKSTTAMPSDNPVAKEEKSNIQPQRSSDTLETVIVQQKATKLPVVKENKTIIAIAPDSRKTSTTEVVIEQPRSIETVPQQQTAELALQRQPETLKTAEILKPLDVEDAEETSAQAASLLTSDDNANAHPAVYKELDTDDDNHTLYVGSFQLNRAKVNGLLKSASRLLGNKAKGTATE